MRRKSVWTNSLLSITLSVLISIMFIILSSVILAIVMYYVLGDMKVSAVFAAVAICAGTYSATYLCGKYRRKRGIAEGVMCGVIIYTIMSICGVVFLGEITGVKKLLLLVLSGGAGGVTGVNSKRPKNYME